MLPRVSREILEKAYRVLDDSDPDKVQVGQYKLKCIVFLKDFCHHPFFLQLFDSQFNVHVFVLIG